MTLNEMIKIIFDNKNKWNLVSNETKEKYFFIFNRLMSYDFPFMAQSLNHKKINTSIAMDIWFNFLSNKKIKHKWREQKLGIEEIIKKKSNLSTLELNLIKTNYPECYENFIKKSKFNNVE